jgi:hypothetical protein
MGTNLSQVFILNNGNLIAPGSDGDDSFVDAGSAQVGIWNTTKYGTNDDQWINTKLYATTVAEVDTAAAVDGTPIVNPLWLYSQIQFVQGTANNPIATPIINTSQIKSIEFSPFEASTRHAGTVTFALDDAGDDLNVKFIIRNTPTAHLNFTNDNPGLIDLSGNNFDFPLGSFNTTNHKAINIGATGATATTAGDDLVANIQNSPVLNALFTASNTTGVVTITARHAGVVFDMIAHNNTDDTVPVVSNATAKAKVGVGNAWQVLGEEIRCRSRYGNFNRMYFPDPVATYTNTTYKYHKVTIEYATNWPSSTGIAPAGELNQVVIYAADSSTAMAAGDTTIDAAFALPNVTGQHKFVW